ncbi:hypothetical protein ACFVWN_25520 [Nocardiopsis flavescens]|uniref:hypothetical protein n=1 Tax=Nocardiopsis flavescens TaxID=758803 RepID=UPI00365E67F3
MTDKRRISAAVRSIDALPQINSPEFPQEVRKLAEKFKDPEEIFRAVASTRSVNDRARFVALYGWLLRLRREERHDEYARVVNQYDKKFGTEPYFLTFRAIVARNRGDRANLRRSIELSKEAARHLQDVAGVAHQLAAFMVDYFERNLDSLEKSEILEAERSVDHAIFLSSGRIAHYFETKARLLVVGGNFEEARSSINRAIELEPRSTKDYHRRLTQYQTTRTKIDLMEQQDRWNEIQKENKRELVEFKSQQLQLLGVLAAIVALMATVGNIAARASAEDGFRLIQVMAGSVILVFSTFSLMSGGRISRIATAYSIGVLMIASPAITDWVFQ